VLAAGLPTVGHHSDHDAALVGGQQRPGQLARREVEYGDVAAGELGAWALVCACRPNVNARIGMVNT
jgi:hypothetical protein